MADWSMAQFLLTLSLIPITVQLFWWVKVKVAVRHIRTLTSTSAGTCERLKWDDDIPEGVLHTCNGPIQCHSQHHISGRDCFDSTLNTVFRASTPRERHRVPKPDCLPSGDSFVETDRMTILAFIVCTVNPKDFNEDVAIRRPLVFNKGGTTVLPRKDPDTGIITVHLEGCFERSLSKKEVKRILSGWPPYYRESFPCQTASADQPTVDITAIKDDSYRKRGGWIIAAALSDIEPVPVYVDNVRYQNSIGETRRGGAFWQSIDWVLSVLENNVFPHYPYDRNVEAAINCIRFVRGYGTESPAGRWLSGTGMEYNMRKLLPREMETAVRIFNQPPSLPETDKTAYKKALDPMLIPVLDAAVKGVIKCVEYVKNPGRELDELLPELLDTSGPIYVRGCS